MDPRTVLAGQHLGSPARSWAFRWGEGPQSVAFARGPEVCGQRGRESGEASQERSHIHEWSLEHTALPTRAVLVDANMCPSSLRGVIHLCGIPCEILNMPLLSCTFTG